jgi:Fe2+ or Zn2+ uptake regulation protein
MTKPYEEANLIDSISIKHIVNLSIVDMVMLQLLLKHEKPVVRHILYNEISQFLTREKQKVVKSIKFDSRSPGAREFKDLLNEDKKISTSSFYNSLKNLEGKGLVKSNRDENHKITSVEATQYTEVLINTISKHVIRFGLIEAEKNKIFPDIIKEVIENEILNPNKGKKAGTALYVSFGDDVNTKCIKNLFKTTDNLFLLLKKEIFEKISNIGLENIKNTSIFNNTIREPDNFFDIVIIPYHFKTTDIEDISKETILKEAFRIIKDDGVVLIHGYTELPNIEHALLSVYINWVKNVYIDTETSSETKFKELLLESGANQAKVFVYKGHLFGLGRKKLE